MTDIVDNATRSQMMSGIRGRDTQPEMAVRRALFSAGFRFRLHRRDLPGAPDIVLPGRKIAIFVHGCFWHRHGRCRYSKLPANRPDFWKAKLEGNVERDARAVAALLDMNWRVLVVWECTIRNQKTLLVLPATLGDWIRGAASFGEVSDGATR